MNKMVVEIDTLEAQRDRFRQEVRTDARKFAVQFVLAISAALGVGVAIGRFLFFHQ
jgi:hypothetical protein